MGLLGVRASAGLALASAFRGLAGAALRAAGADLGRDFGAEGGLFGVAIRVKLSGRRK
jgi:hypothetical protein